MAPDDRSFDDIMRSAGVTPLSNHPGPKSASRKKDPAKVPIPPRPVNVPTGPSPSHLETSNQELEAKLTKLETECTTLRSENKKATQQVDAIEQRLLAAEARAETADVATADQKKLANTQVREQEKKRRDVEANLSRANEELGRLAKRLSGKRSIRELLEARGLKGETEFAIALGGLLLSRIEDLLDTSEIADPERFAQMLDQRLALVHESIAKDIDNTAVIVQVPEGRCEIAGGSDVRATFHRLAQSCANKSLQNLTIVGGSPAYRKQLETMAKSSGDDLKLNLVSGTQRRASRRVESDLRASDLVVIWGSTRLDHSVSEPYMRGTKKPLVIQHRGISGMLERLVEAVQKLKG